MDRGDVLPDDGTGRKCILSLPSQRLSSSASLMRGEGPIDVEPTLANPFSTVKAEGDRVHRDTFGRSKDTQAELVLTLQSTTGHQERALAGQSVPFIAKQEEFFSKTPSPTDFAMMEETYTTSLAPRVHDRKRRSSSRAEGSTSQSASLEVRDFATGDGPLQRQAYHQRLSASFEEARRLSGDSQRRYRGIERALEAQNEDVLTMRARTVSEPITSFTLPMGAIARRDANINQAMQSEERLLGQKHASDPLPFHHRSVSPSAPAESSRHVNYRFSAGARSSGLASSGLIPWDAAQFTALSIQRPLAIERDGNDDDNIMPVADTRLSMPNHDDFRQERLMTKRHLTALHTMRAKLPSDAHNNFRNLRHTSILPRLHRLFLPLITYAHVFATIFFDYNTLYSITQVALYPDSSSTSTAWWIAIGIYAASLLVWLFGVVVVWEIVIQYYSKGRHASPHALPIYLSSSAFNLAAMQSASLYSLFYRTRLSASRRDFLIETFWYYSQNWPTVLTLLPRGVILAIFLVLYNPISPAVQSTNLLQNRDSVYFAPSSGLLTSFAFIVLLLNEIWIAWRVLLLLTSYIGLWITLGSKPVFERDRIMSEWIAGSEEATPSTALDRSAHAQVSKEIPRDAIGQGASEADFVIEWPRWAWQYRAEERLKGFLHASDSSVERHMSAAIDDEEVVAQETEGFLVNNVLVQKAVERREAEPRRLRPWVSMSDQSVTVEMNNRDSNSFDKLRAAPRLVLPGNASILTSLQDSPRLKAQSVKSEAKGKEKTREDPNGTFIDKDIFISHERPVSDITLSSVLSSSTARPLSMTRSIIPDAVVMHPFPSDSGELTPTLASTAGRMQRMQSSSPEPLTSETVVPSSIAVIPSPTKRRRASSSLTSLSESLRLGRGSRSAESAGQDDLEQGRVSGNIKTEGAWWSALVKGKSRAASKEKESAEAMEKREISRDLYVEKMEAAATMPANSEQGSLRTHETTTTEDSEERRLWSQFPEQSRRYPPGLIALEMEQRHTMQEQERRQSDEDMRLDTEEGRREQREEDESPRMSVEGLVPIKEESWNSSLDSASNESH